jgi:hypothetical protein
MIGGVRQQEATTRPGPYAAALADVARDLGVTLDRLDDLAAHPVLLADPERASQLAPCQYRLHAAAEAVLSLAPPAEAEALQSDLADALVAGREATAAIVVALERGEPLGSLVYEWRGALFRVRVARSDLAREAEGRRGLPGFAWTRIHGIALLLVALVAIATGAHESAWLVVAGGVAGALGGMTLLLRP